MPFPSWGGHLRAPVRCGSWAPLRAVRRARVVALAHGVRNQDQRLGRGPGGARAARRARASVAGAAPPIMGGSGASHSWSGAIADLARSRAGVAAGPTVPAVRLSERSATASRATASRATASRASVSRATASWAGGAGGVPSRVGGHGSSQPAARSSEIEKAVTESPLPEAADNHAVLTVASASAMPPDRRGR
jgi:hypothetical protein